MRLGDTGLKVDYIVSKLRSYYPEMNSGNLISWSSENTRYLKKYIEEYMPEAIQLLNQSSYNFQTNLLSIEEDRILYDSSSLDINSPEYVTTIGQVVYTHRGSPYLSNPLKLVSFPVDLGKTYKLLLRYNNSDSIPINFANIDHDWSLNKYLLGGYTNGKLISDGQLVSSSSISYATNKRAKKYFKLDAFSYVIPFDQLITIQLTDNLVLSGGNFLINGVSFTAGTGANSIEVKYDSVNEKAHLLVGGVTLYTSHPYLVRGESITLPASNPASINLTRSGDIYNLVTGTSGTQDCPAISGIQIKIVDTTSGGVVLSTALNVVGQSNVVTNNNTTLTGLSINIDNYSYSFDINDNLVTNAEGVVTISSGDIVIVDGVTYRYIGDSPRTIEVHASNIIETLPSSDSNPSYEDNVDVELEFDLTISNGSEPDESANTRITVNEDGTHNLLIQVPASTINYRLIQVASNGEHDLFVDYSDYSDGTMVSNSYLDSILLDRVITQYSNPDDIEYAQWLVAGDGYKSEFNYLGVFNEDLRSSIINYQSDVSKLNRTYYKTGWIDPETEISMEVKNGY